MDVRMPEMDGFQATHVIRAKGERSSAVPIIAFTANAFPEDIAACREAGMNDFVVKPARKKALVEAVLRVLPQPEQAVIVLTEAATPPLAAMIDTPPGEEPAFDPQAFQELSSEIGEQGADEVRTIFLGETDTRLVSFRQLSIESDRKTIRREAHSLKSAAGTFGYRRLSRLAKHIEKNVEHLTASEYHELVDGLDAAYTEARAQDLRQTPR
jgi:DNA-binding response OmpR family regulator